MSIQDCIAVPFEIKHDQRNLRLLELPPTLLELVVSKDPPSFSLKSTKPDSENSIQHNAVFCTNDQTFHVRQVQSSNTVFLIEPTSRSLDSDSSLSYDVGVQAIAQCASTLELVPASLNGSSILKRILPTYNVPTDGVEHDEYFTSQERLSRETAFDNTPLSRRQFDDAWKDTCSFEILGVALLPSANCLGGIWKSIISAATQNNIDLTESFGLIDLIDTVDEDSFPRDLLDAVIKRVTVNSKGILKELKTVDQDECVSWIGSIILEARTSPDKNYHESEFLHDWQNHLPEKWRGHTKISALKCKYSHQSNGLVKLEPGDFGSSQSSAAPIADGKRLGKWHEKFKSTRR